MPPYGGLKYMAEIYIKKKWMKVHNYISNFSKEITPNKPGSLAKLTNKK